MRPGSATALLAALALALSGCALFDRDPEPEPAAEAFAQAWRDGAVDPAMLADPAAAAGANELLGAAAEELGGPPELEVRAVTTEEERTSARVGVTWPLPSGPWSYEVTLPLVLAEVEDGRAWQVAWQPSALHPQLAAGQTLDLRTVVPERAAILAADGSPLFTPRPVVTVGVEPRRVQDLDRVLAVLADTLQIEPDPLRQRVAAAAPEAFVDVVTLRREEYEPLRGVLQPVPGLVFREGERVLTPGRDFARALLGRVGPATEEVLAEAPPGFGPGDELGLSGLQRQFQAQLAGVPGGEVVAADAEGRPVATLHTFAATPGTPLRTTLVPEVQAAADATLASVSQPSALVAVRPSTGEVLAVAHGPGGGGANTALTGQYPPGSSYKIVSTAALLAGGLTPDQVVTCPPTATVGGKEFRNAEGRADGQVTYREAFAQSCNTTIAPLAAAVPDDAMTAAAAAFGFGGGWDPGTGAFPGQAPPPADDAERAAAAIGQGRVLASPLLMATAVAAVADGTWRPPVLLPDHARPGEGPRPLDPATAEALRDLTRAVVEQGTGSALRAVPGAPVLGKTGTAEFGTEVPPRTHAWFVGARGDLAVAVLVEDGGGGGAVAAPLAAAFLSRLP